MKTFSIVLATSLMLLSTITGYVCALESGYEWMAHNVAGYLGMLMFPGVIALALVTGHALGVCGQAPAPRQSRVTGSYGKNYGVNVI